MKALIERQLYQPAVVLPLLLLMRLMVTLDFNLAQVMLVMIAKGSQHAYRLIFTRRAADVVRSQVCKHVCTHC